MPQLLRSGNFPPFDISLHSEMAVVDVKRQLMLVVIQDQSDNSVEPSARRSLRSRDRS
jgi:hypothetical protein